METKPLRIPDFLIVGAARSGTTSLYHYLKQHPGLFLPERKEPAFFTVADEPGGLDDPLAARAKMITRPSDYRQLFETAHRGQKTGEASTVYLYLHDRTIQNLSRFHRNATEMKIIVVLRNPVERAYSHYLYHVREGVMEEGFGALLERCRSGRISPLGDVVRRGFYHDQVKAYLEAFPRTRVFLFNDLVEDPQGVVRETFSFLGVDPTIHVDTAWKANISGVPRHRGLVRFLLEPHPVKEPIKALLSRKQRAKLKTALLERVMTKPRLDPSTRRELEEIYRPEILRLQDLLGRDLSAWLT